MSVIITVKLSRMSIELTVNVSVTDAPIVDVPLCKGWKRASKKLENRGDR